MFTGFTDATVDFMWGIRFNNEKSWFEAHKEVYLNEFYQPMKDLAGELYDFIAEKRPHDPLVCKVSRIYRDARRLHGRGPYKDHLWLSIATPAENWTTHPAFWFELGPEWWGYGMGCWMAKPADMAKLRARVDRDPATMTALTKKLNDQTEFTLSGATYKKPRSPAPSALLSPWYQMKSVAITHEEPLSEILFERTLVDRLKQGYEFLLPYYDYFLTLSSEPETGTQRACKP